MSPNTYRRLTAGSPKDDLPAIIDAIERDAFQALHRAEMCAGEIEVRTTLALLLRQALENLATQLREDLDDATEKARQARDDWELLRAAYNSDITLWRARQDTEASMAEEIAVLREYIATLEAAKAQQQDWDFLASTWDGVPNSTVEQIERLQNDEQAWTELDNHDRLLIARHVCAMLGDPDVKTFDLARPEWMPPAKILTQSFQMQWRGLLGLRPPWS